MTEQALSSARSPEPGARPKTRRPSLYRRVLSLGVAAIVAAWLPFSVMYIGAVNKQATHMAAITAQHPGSAATRVITTASGATRVLAANSATAPSAAAALTPVTTRVS